MTDIARVYAFLAKQEDWVSKADSNGDGTVIKTEFQDFMEANFEWDGETTDAGKNDLINTFWKTIDTNQSGKISGTTLKNKNALDKKEIAAMNNKIEVYESFNQYTSSISAPSVIGDTANWKKSVSEGLEAYIEPYIKAGGTAEGLAEYLDGLIDGIEAKATADYCAQEYLAKVMGDIVNQYGYAYGDDKTLQGMIDKYIQNLPEGITPEEIQQTVYSIIDAYMSTAGLNNEDIEDLNEFGYAPTENSPLNDLQKSIIQSKLQQKVETLEDYETHKDLYTSAMTTYINSVKYGDFASVNSNVLESFKASAAYISLSIVIKTENVFTSDDFYSMVSKNLNETLADKIKNDGRYLTAMKEIEAQALEKAANGDFNTNGVFDANKVLDWALTQIKSRVAEFYPNGFGDMSLSELNSTYDMLSDAAEAETDDDKACEAHRNAAIQYCKALTAKSSKFAEIISVVFGDNYTTAIKSMLPSKIEAKMTELKAKAAELGDPKEMANTDAVNALWGATASNYSVIAGKTASFKLGNSFSCNGATVTSDRITYSTSNSAISIAQDGTATINGSAVGQYTTTVKILVDGVEVTSKTITINIIAAANVANDGNTVVNGESIANIMSNNSNGFKSNWFSPGQSYAGGIAFINSSLENIKTSLIGGGYDTDKTNRAINILKGYYTNIISATNNWRSFSKKDYGGKGTFNQALGNYTYTDANGNIQTLGTDTTWKEYKNAYDLNAGETSSASGFGVSHSRKDSDKYQFYINTRTLLQLFESIYNNM